MNLFDRIKEFANDLVDSPRRRTQPENVAAFPQEATDAGYQFPKLDQIMLGADLAAYPPIAEDVRTLLADVLNDDPTAVALAGQFFIFRSADAERIPTCLKEIGEAYYRWRPDTAYRHDVFRDTLIAWLTGVSQQAGVKCTIELTSPGDRFDASRHASRHTGVEVNDVFGWVVLRENGKVYAKADVTVR